MLTVFVASLLAIVANSDGAKPNPRSSLETAIPHFIRLLEEEKYDAFIDEAIYPSRLKDYLARMSREKLVEGLREGRMQIIELLKEVQKLKGVEFKPLLKEYDLGMKYTSPDGGSFSFYRRNGLWSGAF